MENTHLCPVCNEPVDSESLVCSHCGSDLSKPVLTLKQDPSASQQTEPIQVQPAGQIPSGGIHITVNNDLTPLHTAPAKAAPQHPRRHGNPWWWILAFVLLGVVLILGTVAAFAANQKPPVAVHPTPTAIPPTPTPTAIPQAHVVIQLDDVMCVTTRDFFRADGFYIKSSFSAPGINGQTITKTKTSIHYNVNDGDTVDFNAADQVVFDANIPLGGLVNGSLTAYSDDDGNMLGTTNVKNSATDFTQHVTWHIQGRSFLNTWEDYVHYTISINKVTATTPIHAATIRGTLPSTVGGLAFDAPASRRRNA